MQINKKQEEFNDLQTARKNLRAEIRRNNYSGMYSYLSNMYEDVTHFIYEMIQNADDTNASYFDLRLFKDRVEIRHNGNPFTIEDVTSITSIGDSKKKDKIGYKGIGFKSIFAFSDRPAIYSEYNFEIEDYIVPITIESNEIQKNDKETLIVLPFIKDQSTDEVYKKINKKIDNLNIKEFLFLNNIEKFIFSVDDREVKKIYKIIEDLGVENSKKFILKSEQEIIKYLVINDNDDEFVKIAFRIDEDTDINKINIIPESIDEECSSIYAFFPTEEEINFKFLIQGPYDTSQDRKSIDFQKSVNKKIISNTAELLGQCMEILKKLNVLDINAFKVLPINERLADNSIIYKQFYDELGEKICNGKILITNSNKYCNLNEVLLAEDKQIWNIFEAKHFTETDNTKWLSDVFIEIKDTLVEYGLKIIDDNYIIKNLDIKYIQEMNDSKLLQFYKYIFSTKEKFLKYSKLAIIRTNDNSFKSYFDNYGNENIFLRVVKEIDSNIIEQLEINIFNKELYSSDQELAMLIDKNKIFREFNASAIIDKLLKANMKDNKGKLVHNLYFENLIKIIKAFKYICDENDKIAIIKSIEKDLPILYNDPLKNKRFHGSLYDKSRKYYWLDNDIKKLYDNFENVEIKTKSINYEQEKHLFIDVELYKEKMSEELLVSLVELLKKCGVSDNIYILNEKTCWGRYDFYIEENKKKFDARQYSPTLPEKVYNPTILYIEDILKNIDNNQSKILWKVVFEFFNKLEFRTKGYFINNFGSSSKTIEIILDIISLLSTTKWIFINGEQRKPNEIKYVDLLKNDYFLGNENDEVILNKYKRLCMLLDISINQKYSKKELEAQEKVNYLNKEELLKLIKYIELRIEKNK